MTMLIAHSSYVGIAFPPDGVPTFVVGGRRSQTFDSARAFARAFLPSARRTSSMES